MKIAKNSIQDSPYLAHIEKFKRGGKMGKRKGKRKVVRGQGQKEAQKEGQKGGLVGAPQKRGILATLIPCYIEVNRRLNS